MMKINKDNNRFSVVILAAGTSTRMGLPKFLLRYNDSFNFLEKIVNEFTSFGCEEIIAVINKAGAMYLKDHELTLKGDAKIVVNHHPEWERFYSLKTGLKNLKNKKQSVFIQNVDNPFVSQSVIGALSEKSKDADYISPVFNGNGGHPILLSEKIIEDIVNSKHDQADFKEFLNNYFKKTVEVNDDKIVVNINTFEDYRNLFKI